MRPGARRHRRLWTVISVALSVFAALLWARLKLVTGLPRTAYADQEAPPPPGGNAPRPAVEK